MCGLGGADPDGLSHHIVVVLWTYTSCTVGESVLPVSGALHAGQAGWISAARTRARFAQSEL